MSEAHKYQQVSAKSPGSASMKDQEGVNEIPSSHQDGSDDDVPLPQQGFAVIHQQGDSDEGGGSSDEGEDQMQNGGYQLLSQEVGLRVHIWQYVMRSGKTHRISNLCKIDGFILKQ